MARREYPSDYRRDFDRVMSDLQRRLSEARAGRQVAMPEIQVDVREQDKDVVVTADLPGYDVEEISLRLTDPKTLQISAQGEETSIEEREDYYIRERSFGAVSRIVDLPSPVTTEDAFATCNNGVLEVHLPKTPEARGREIPIGGGEQQQTETTRKTGEKARPTKPSGEEQFRREQEQYKREQQEAEAATKKTTSRKSVESMEEIQADLEQGLSPEAKKAAEERRRHTEELYREDRKKFE